MKTTVKVSSVKDNLKAGEKRVNFTNVPRRRNQVAPAALTGSVTVALDDDLNVGDTLRVTIEKLPARLGPPPNNRRAETGYIA